MTSSTCSCSRPISPPPRAAVPPPRAVPLFPPIRAGSGRHRLVPPVRRRPGPVAAGLLVAAATLSAGALRADPAARPAGPATQATAHPPAPPPHT